MLFSIVIAAAVAAVVADVPNWEPTYLMPQSTAFMPCNFSGLFSPEYAAKWGLVDFDWSNGKTIWANASPMDDEELLIAQASAVKAVNPNTRVFVYRNLVKALPWYTSVREKIDDPAYEGWFIKFKPEGPYYSPPCTNNTDGTQKCSMFYHDQEQTPKHGAPCVGDCDCGSVPCGEYLWNHANGTSLREFLINEFVLGPTGLGNANVSGFYLDDSWHDEVSPHAKQGQCDSFLPIGGPTEMEKHCVLDMGLTAANTTAITSEWATTVAAVHQAILDHGGLSWQQLGRANTPTTAASPTNATCPNYFRGACQADSKEQTAAMLFEFAKNANGTIYPLPAEELDVATFLLARGPYAFLGYNWAGCNVGDGPPSSGSGPYTLPASTQVDYGTPVGLCKETSPGVFTREWTKGSAQVDCNTMTATIKHSA